MALLPSEFKIRFIKRMDSLFGRAIVKLLSAPVPLPDIQIRSILIIRPGGIGDGLLLAPVICSLKSRYPDANITILAESRNAGAFSLIPTVDQMLIYDRPRDLIRLFSSTYDLIIDTEQWHRMSAVIARLIPSFMKIGFATNERGRLFTAPVQYCHNDYEAQSFLNLFRPLGINEFFNHSFPFISVPDRAVGLIKPLLGSVRSPYICVFPGASIKERRWGTEKFRSLVLHVARSGVSAVIVGGKEDQSTGDAIVAGTNGLNLAGKTSIDGTAAVIGGARLLISGDSGVLHIGVGLGIPTVSLFGAGIANKWAPQGVNHKVINMKLSCSPCTLFGTTPACPNNVRCLEEIEVKMVCDAVDLFLIDKWGEK